MSQSSDLLQPNIVINDRYRIIRCLGSGGFGRTYLAEDSQRFQEKCVLKEFAPQVSSEEDLRKAEDLFEREAGILYKLKHQQIPNFHALLRTRIRGKEALFLVQEYIPGKTYWDYVKEGKKFTQQEVSAILKNILPVLAYIHQLELIHRDISPDNLIHNSETNQTVLIDFGCVKVAANALSQTPRNSIKTVIGKKGFAPEEQIRYGQTFPCSDLYSLAVTCLVLLTGKKPEELYDIRRQTWIWQKEVQVSRGWAKILTKMLADLPQQRYQSATEVIAALEKLDKSLIERIVTKITALSTNLSTPQQPTKSSSSSPALPITEFTGVVQSRLSRLKTQVLGQNNQNKSKSAKKTKNPNFLVKKLKLWQLRKISNLLILFILFMLVSLALVQNISSNQSNNQPTNLNEQARQDQINRRIAALKINRGLFYSRVDQMFYAKYPHLRGVTLTSKAKHKAYREAWYKIAENLLQQVEKSQKISNRLSFYLQD